ncbi:hypothetical protein PQR64_36355 [Paraburkholderia phytofirmans]|uniref:hypothetical protein n=1 Tax=Paraburkholderia phytofirmans TaxID=261302 RepID=UPI0038BCB7FE
MERAADRSGFFLLELAQSPSDQISLLGCVDKTSLLDCDRMQQTHAKSGDLPRLGCDRFAVTAWRPLPEVGRCDVKLDRRGTDRTRQRIKRCRTPMCRKKSSTMPRVGTLAESVVIL